MRVHLLAQRAGIFVSEEVHHTVVALNANDRSPA
jgi:hypothetical protein